MSATIVYVGNAESNEIHVLRLDRQHGDLTAVEQVPIPGIATPGTSTPMAVSPDRRFLYVGTRGEPKIAAGFAIDPAAGTLRHVASGPLADSMACIATDRTGRFLLGASYPGHKVTVNPIGPPGTVQPARQVLTDHPNAHSIGVDRANRHVLVPTLGNDHVNQFTFDAATGTLAPNTPPAVEVRAKAGPRHFAFHPGGARVYVLGELDGAVYVFDYDAGAGTLEQKQSVSTLRSRLPGQARGRRPAPHARRPVPLCVGARVEHAGGLPGRPGERRPSRPSAACRPRSNRAASPSIPPAATCSRSASSPTACRATRSTRRAARSPG